MQQQPTLVLLPPTPLPLLQGTHAWAQNKHELITFETMCPINALDVFRRAAYLVTVETIGIHKEWFGVESQTHTPKYVLSHYHTLSHSLSHTHHRHTTPKKNLFYECDNQDFIGIKFSCESTL